MANTQILFGKDDNSLAKKNKEAVETNTKLKIEITNVPITKQNFMTFIKNEVATDSEKLEHLINFLTKNFSYKK
jgi:hypothetical protein